MNVRVAVLFILLTGLSGLVVTAAIYHRSLLEQWYLLRLDSSNEEARDYAIEALVAMRSKKAVQPLLTALEEQLAEEELAARRWRAVNESTYKAQLEDHYAVEALVQLGSVSAGTLIRLVTEDPTHRLKGTTVINMLYRMDAEVLPTIVGALRDESTHSFLQIFCRARRTEVGPVLSAALRHPDVRLRFGAATVVERYATSELVPALIDALNMNENDDEGLARSAAARALGSAKSETSYPHLVLALHDDSSQVREAAAFALGRCGDRRLAVVKALRRAARDETVAVRQAAEAALEQLGAD